MILFTKKILLPLLAFILLPSCSKTSQLVTLNAIYMDINEQGELCDSKYNIEAGFAFEKNYVLTEFDIDMIGKSSCAYAEHVLQTYHASNDYIVYGLYFDIEGNEKLQAGYTIKEDITLYFGYTKHNPFYK